MEDFDPDETYTLGSVFDLTGSDVVYLGTSARVSVIGAPDEKIEPSKWFLRTNGTDEAEHEEIHKKLYGDFDEYDKSCRVAVTGPVYITFDNNSQPQSKADHPVIAVSTPGMNFAAKASPDRKRFLDETTSQLINTQEVVKKMKTTWHHVLDRFQSQNVKYAVLCGLGCGVFAGGLTEVCICFAVRCASLRIHFRFRNCGLTRCVGYWKKTHMDLKRCSCVYRLRSSHSTTSFLLVRFRSRL